MTPITLRFETCLPDGLDTIAEVVEDVTALNATACGEETADITSDVTTDVECLRVIERTVTASLFLELVFIWVNIFIPCL